MANADRHAAAWPADLSVLLESPAWGAADRRQSDSALEDVVVCKLGNPYRGKPMMALPLATISNTDLHQPRRAALWWLRESPAASAGAVTAGRTVVMPNAGFRGPECLTGPSHTERPYEPQRKSRRS